MMKLIKSKKQNKSRPELRLSAKEMGAFLNKKVRVKYDNKKFEGMVEDLYLEGPHNSGFIIENEGEFKHIKLHRIEEIKEI